LIRISQIFPGKIVTSAGFECAAEILYKAVRSGLSISEVPFKVDWSRRKGNRKCGFSRPHWVMYDFVCSTQGRSMKLLTVVGARPQFVKLAPLSHAIKKYNLGAAPGQQIKHEVLHTGQHFDPNMSQVFFDELELDPPDIQLQGAPAVTRR